MKQKHYGATAKFNLLKNKVSLGLGLYFWIALISLVGGVAFLVLGTIFLGDSTPLKTDMLTLYLKSLWGFTDYVMHNGHELLKATVQKSLYPKFVETISYYVGFFIFGALISGVVSWFITMKLSEKSSETLQDQHIRGTDILTEDQLSRDQKRKKMDGHNITPLIQVDRLQETKHLLVVGGVGSGKTVLISRLLEARIRHPKNINAKFIVNDLKPDWIQYFFNPETDFIFNYSDKRSIYFNIFSYFVNEKGEISETDLITLCSLIVEEDPKDKMWTGLAKDVLKSILIVCVVEDTMTLNTVKGMLGWKATKLKKKFLEFEGTEKGVQALTGSDGTVGSVMVTLSSNTKFFEGISDTCHENKEVFDLNAWLKKKGQSKIFMINDIKNKEFNAPKVSVFVDTLMKAIWALGEDTTPDKSRRIYFFLDELGAISKLNSLESAITVGRSFGISITIGIQDIAKFDHIYTESMRKTILNSLSSRIFLRAQDSETAKYLSDMIGEKEYTETDQSASIGTESNRDGIGFNKKVKKEMAVIPAEIMNLKDHEFFFKQPEQNWTRVEGKIYPEVDSRIQTTEAYVECQGLRKKYGRKATSTQVNVEAEKPKEELSLRESIKLF